jgi:hypothetical protein
MSTHESVGAEAADRGTHHGDDLAPNGHRVVHTECDEDLAALVDASLRHAHPDVSPVWVDTDDTVEAVAEVAPRADCDVTDHRQPLTDAVDAAEAVAQTARDVPVIAFSGVAGDIPPGTDLDGVVAKRNGLAGLDALVERISRAVGPADGGGPGAQP